MMNYPFTTNYSPYQNAYNPIPAVPQMNTQNNGLNWVQGENGAKSWLIGKGETALLMDSENDVFYIKSTDMSGMPLPLRVFDYKERTTTQKAQESSLCVTNDNFITRTEFDELRAKYDELEKQIKAKSTPKQRDENAE